MSPVVRDCRSASTSFASIACRPGEVKAHQILIVPKIDSADVARARSARRQRRQAFEGRRAVRYARQEVSRLRRQGRDEPSHAVGARQPSETYQKAFDGKKAGDIVAFQIPGSAQRPDIPKFVVAQLLTVDEARRAHARRDEGGGSLRARAARRRPPLRRRAKKADVRVGPSRGRDAADSQASRDRSSRGLSVAVARPRLAVTLGDVRGIGPEIVAKAAASREVRDAADLVFVGPSGAGVDVDERTGATGTPDGSAADAGRFAGRAIERAVALALEGDVDGIVTAPLDKAALLAGGYRIPATPRCSRRSRADASR